jgi:hypothetical protein
MHVASTAVSVLTKNGNIDAVIPATDFLVIFFTLQTTSSIPGKKLHVLSMS